ncbi:MAG: electron transport complex subunit RsxC [Gammaproteobacteria bacterium]
MKLYRFKGGVHPEAHKVATGYKCITPFPMPARLYLPVQQHIGAPANPEVSIDQHVLKGERLAGSQGAISAPIHAPTSGTIADITDCTAPHPSGLAVRTIILEPDGKDQWVTLQGVKTPFLMDPDEVAARVGAAGIVGLGGATFPSAVKLNLGKNNKVYTLIINGSECEPYLTCDDLLMQSRAEKIVDGIRIMLHGLQAPRALIAIEDNKHTAIKAMQKACKNTANVDVVVVPTLYPMGSEKQMIKTLTGMDVPAGKRSIDIGVLVHNVGTAFAVHRAIRFGEPLVSRIVTMGGGAILNPQNLEVPIGTHVSDVIEFCGGFKEKPERILMGGPMMGQLLPSTDVPIVKGTSGIIALTKNEITQHHTMPCIRCGSCITACPCGLLPLEMANRARKGDIEGAVNFGLMDCISCGSCSYVCPSYIPLVQYFNFAKGEVVARQKEQQHQEQTKILAEKRTERIEREKKEKAEAAVKRKAERAAKQAAEEAKKESEAVS